MTTSTVRPQVSILWMPAVPSKVGYGGKSGKHMLAARFTPFDPIRSSAGTKSRNAASP